MKKLILILIAFSFSGLELNAQNPPNILGIDGWAKIHRSTGIGADRSTHGGAFGLQGDWSTDLVISEKTPEQAAGDFLGPSHNGMGATGWGSFAAGAYNRASGAGAVAIGFHNVAGPTGPAISNIPPSTTNLGGQFAVGYGTQATGHAAFSAGEGTTASGHYSTAMGFGTTADGDYTTALGFGTTASQNYSVAMGEGTSASGHTSFSIGRLTSASGMRSLATGEQSTASGLLSTVMGYNTMASDYASLAIGRFNSASSSATSANSFDSSAPAFVIGNGLDNSNRSDAFKVMFNGDATVSNDLTVSGDVVVSSDARLKANIASLGSTIAKLLLIDGKSYTMKKDGKQKIGVLAQDVQKVFPELVSKDDNEMLAVNYQGLVPVLINALKEQDEKISRLENLVEKLISEK
jgi:hypothetical protein